MSFLRVGKMFNSEVMKDVAKDIIESSINVENALFVFEGSILFNLPRLKVSALKCIFRWFSYLVSNKKHYDLKFDSFRSLLFSSALDITSEMEVVIAADSWIKHDYKQRNKFAKELIKQIRLPLLSKACLEKLLPDYSSFSSCEDSRRYINNAIENQSLDTYDPNSIGNQARYCSQENFEIILSEEHNLYKLENSKSSYAIKRVENLLKLDTSTYRSIFINGVIYLMGPHFTYAYSTIKGELIEKNRSGEKHLTVNASICNFMGKINIIGGWHANGRRLTIYDPELDTWEERAEMSVNKINVAFSVFCGKLVVTGGFIRVQHLMLRSTNTVEIYDHFSNKWSPMPEMIEEKCYHDSVSIGSKLYVISYESCCEVFDYFSNVFVRILNRMPRSWFSGVKCLSIGNKIITISDRSFYKYVEFDVEKQEWSEVFKNNWIGVKVKYYSSCFRSPMC